MFDGQLLQWRDAGKIKKNLYYLSVKYEEDT